MIITKKALPRRTFLRGLGATLALAAAGFHGSGAVGQRAAAKPARAPGVRLPPDGHDPGPLDAGGRRRGLRVHAHHEGARAVPRAHQRAERPGAGEGRALGDGPGDHAREGATWLTGVHPKKTEGAGIQCGISADQIAARELGKQTQLASLEIGLEAPSLAGGCDSGYSCAYTNTVSWRAATTPLPHGDQSARGVRAPLRRWRQHRCRRRVWRSAEGAAQHSRLRRRQHRPPGDEARHERPQQAQRIPGSHPRHRAAHSEGRAAERRR